MKRKQKRFTEEREILSEIQRRKDEAAKCLAGAIECDKVADTCFKQIRQFKFKLANANRTEAIKIQMDIMALKSTGEQKRTEARTLSQRRNTLENCTIPALGRTLAAFKTELLSFTDDPGVVIQ